jgi:ACS family hexuronate transporter-like MFS transporter
MFTDPYLVVFPLLVTVLFCRAFPTRFEKPSIELIVVYTATTIGSIGGGYLSGYLIKKGWTVFKARKASMLSFALAVLPVFFAQYCTNIWQAVGLIALAMAAHQA